MMASSTINAFINKRKKNKRKEKTPKTTPSTDKTMVGSTGKWTGLGWAGLLNKKIKI